MRFASQMCRDYASSLQRLEVTNANVLPRDKGSSFGDPKVVKGEFDMIPVRGKHIEEGTVCYYEELFWFRFRGYWILLKHTSPELAKLHMIRYVERPSRSICIILNRIGH